MRKTLIGLITLMLFNLTVKAQQYLLFENLKGKNSHKIASGTTLSMNHVELVSGDSTLNLYNWLISTTDSSSNKMIVNGKKISSTAVIVAVPLDVRSRNVRKLTRAQLKSYPILSMDSLLAITFRDLARHMQGRTILMPPLKTLSYGLIIKEGDDHLLVDGQVLVCQFREHYEPTYFPDEYGSGTLALHPENKTYQFKDIDPLEKDFRKKKLPHTWLNKIVNKIYLSKVEQNTVFWAPIFHFWEYPSDDVISSLLPLKQLQEFNMGLGSFEYVKDVGVTNATLDTFLKKQILFQQQSKFHVKTINGMSIADYGRLLSNN